MIFCVFWGGFEKNFQIHGALLVNFVFGGVLEERRLLNVLLEERRLLNVLLDNVLSVRFRYKGGPVLYLVLIKFKFKCINFSHRAEQNYPFK